MASPAIPGSPGEAAEEADGPACVLKGGVRRQSRGQENQRANGDTKDMSEA